MHRTKLLTTQTAEMKKYPGYFSLFFAFSFLLAIKPDFSIAQKDTSVDNGYYITYPDKLMVRLFLLQKYAPFTISGPVKELNYKTSSKLMLVQESRIAVSRSTFLMAFLFLLKTREKVKQKAWIFNFTNILINGQLICWVHFGKAITLTQRKIILLV